MRTEKNLHAFLSKRIVYNQLDILLLLLLFKPTSAFLHFKEP